MIVNLIRGRDSKVSGRHIYFCNLVNCKVNYFLNATQIIDSYISTKICNSFLINENKKLLKTNEINWIHRQITDSKRRE